MILKNSLKVSMLLMQVFLLIKQCLWAYNVEDFQSAEFIEPASNLQAKATQDRPDRIDKTKACLNEKKYNENYLQNLDTIISSDLNVIALADQYYKSWDKLKGFSTKLMMVL